VNSVEFPINRTILEKIVLDIFGSIDFSVVDDLEKSLETFNGLKIPDIKKFVDESILDTLRDVPLSIAENILLRYPLLISSHYYHPDMKPMKDSILPLYTRTMGLLLRHASENNSRTCFAQIDENLWDKFEVEPENPDCEVPALKDLIVGNYPRDLKIKFLLFLFGEIIPKETFELLPIEFLISFLILVYLVKVSSDEN
jgi:hypothetical protein